MIPVRPGEDPGPRDDFLPLKEARQRLGIGDSTIRRWIHKGKLRGERREGLYGVELWVPLKDVETHAEKRQALGLGPQAPPPPRRVEDLPLNELMRWAQAPAVRVAFSQWTRAHSFTFTPLTVLQWMRERLERDQG